MRKSLLDEFEWRMMDLARFADERGAAAVADAAASCLGFALSRSLSCAFGAIFAARRSSLSAPDDDASPGNGARPQALDGASPESGFFFVIGQLMERAVAAGDDQALRAARRCVELATTPDSGCPFARVHGENGSAGDRGAGGRAAPAPGM